MSTHRTGPKVTLVTGKARSELVRGQKLTLVGPKQRRTVKQVAESNRRTAEAYAREQQYRQGPLACSHCGAPPCGHLWTAPGAAQPKGQRCCDKCSHEPVSGWQHTHTAWDSGHAFPVCALTMREGEVVFVRRDGVVLFLQLHAHDEGKGRETPRVVFLGRPGEGSALFERADGAAEPHLWEDKSELDELWLAGRMLSAQQQLGQQHQAAQQLVQQRTEQLDSQIAAADAARAARYAADTATSKQPAAAVVVHKTQETAVDPEPEAPKPEPPKPEPPRRLRATSRRARAAVERANRARVSRLCRQAGRHRAARD